MVFKKTTDLDKIKAKARVFAYIDIEFDDENGLYVKHPYFKHVIDGLQVNNRVELIDLRKPEDLKRKREWLIGKIDSANTYSQLLSLFRTNFLPAFLKSTYYYLTNDEYSEALAWIWTIVESPNIDVNVKPKEFIRYFHSASKEKLMDNREYLAYTELPDKITVYRGVNDNGSKNGLSWTTDLEKAVWFATRFGGVPHVFKGNIQKEYILAYFLGRGESEVVIDYRMVTDLEEIK